MTSKWRVKLFKLLVDGTWEGKEISNLYIANQTSQGVDKKMLQVINEKTNSMTINVPINSDIYFTTQKESILSWRILKPLEQYLYSSIISEKRIWTDSGDEDHSYAVSFQKKDGMKEIKQAIIDLTGIPPREEWTGECNMLPVPTIENLPEIASKIRLDLQMSEVNFLLEELTAKNGTFLRSLCSLFSELEEKAKAHDFDFSLCEDVRKNLEYLFILEKNILYFANSEVYMISISNDLYLDFFGILEYSHESVKSKNFPRHREFLLKKAKFKNILNIQNSIVVEKIQNIYRLTYLRDVAMSSFIEESSLKTINSVISDRNSEIIEYLVSNKHLVSDLVKQLEKIETRLEALNMLSELINISTTCVK